MRRPVSNDDYKRAVEAANLGTYSRARKLFERAALAGNVQAEVELGIFAMQGLTGETNVIAATEHFDRAARLNSHEAHYLLALLALSDPTPRLPGAFFQHLAHAVHGGNPRALCALGVTTGSAAALVKAAALGDHISGVLAPSLKGSVHFAADNLIGELEQQLAPVLVLPEAKFGNPARMLDGVVSGLQASYLCHAARPSLAPALVRDPQNGRAVRLPFRTNRATIIAANHANLTVRLIERALIQIAGFPLLNAEDLGILHYGVNEEYKPHRDYLHDPNLIGPGTPGQRVRTLFCYLNEPELGGETEFLHWNQRISPKLGRVVVFDNVVAGKVDPDSVHAGLPVLAGEKWLATLWLRERRVRKW
jgi:prolyl 4-hydroxylase